MRLKLSLIVAILCCFVGLNAQEDTLSISTDEWSFNDQDTGWVTIDSTEQAKYLSYKPIFSLGYGAISYYGDVRDVYYKDPANGRFALNFSISRGFRSYLDLKFTGIYGELTGNERGPDRNLNFKTNMLNIGLLLSYNFEHLLAKKNLLIPYKKQRRIIPYLSLGIETFSFNSKFDSLDANGNAYNYWSDGTIRNVEESPSNLNNSIILQRDYNYESDLRKQDYDGLGEYALSAVLIPIDACVELQLHDRVQLQLGATYHLALNDLVDNVSKAGQGARKGGKGGDSFLYTYFAIKFDIFSIDKVIYDTAAIALANMDFTGIDFADEDGDNVLDLDDLCPGTPDGAKVNSRGCPLDDDNDGIADYRDKELDSKPGALVGTDGVTLTEEQMIAMSETPEAINSDEICKYYPSMCWKVRKFRSFYLEIPPKFKHLDDNNDEYISLKELNNAIDEFFDFGSDLSIDDIYELNDFFFDQ